MFFFNVFLLISNLRGNYGPPLTPHPPPSVLSPQACFFYLYNLNGNYGPTLPSCDLPHITVGERKEDFQLTPIDCTAEFKLDTRWRQSQHFS